MGLKLIMMNDPDAAVAIAEQQLWMTADGARLVPAGHEDAAQLRYREGERISRADAEAFGLLDEQSGTDGTESGTDGTDGTESGTDGTDGTDGTESGTDGTDGTDGTESGTDGTESEQDIKRRSRRR